jgi:VanZ family protein
MRVGLPWIAVLLWMLLIFYLSSQPAVTSSELSMGITEKVVEQVARAGNDFDINIDQADEFVRKNAHFFLYLLLGVLILNTVRNGGRTLFAASIFAILLSVVYAITDEVHQLFVPGRGAQLQDVGIDTAGAVIGVLLYILMAKVFVRFKTR